MGFIVKGVKSVVKAVVGVVSKVVGSVFGFLVGGKKAKEAETPNTLNKQLDPDASRKIIFGKIAAPLDTRYWEVWGAKGEKFDEVVAHATHRVNAILELYVEDELAINSAGAVQGKFIGVLSRSTALGTIGQAGQVAGGGTQWNANATFDGCAYSIYKWVPDDKKLPNGIPDRYTQVVEGALVYDPRRDSTVAGGSGPHRANDRTTWSYATLDGNGKPIGRNNALQALWYLLGWTIPTKDAGGNVTGEMLVAGRGVAIEDINMASFIAGANACEAAGYYTDLVLSTADSHTSNENAITCDGLIGRLIDPGGLWSYYANVDDTANIAVELTDADILDGVSVNWDEYKGMSEQYNQVGGKFINPSSTVLYQPFPYPLVRDATYEGNLGKKVRKTQDFRQVLDGILGQRLARLLLNEGQYQGEFSGGFNYRALKAQAYSVVRYTSERFGWTKLFRVWRFDISTEGGVGMLLKEIHPSIWQAGTVAAAQPTAAGLKYDPRTEYDVEGFVAAQQSRTAPDGTKYDDIRVSWTAAPNNVRRTEIRYKLNGTAYWTSGGLFERDINTTVLTGLLSGAIYDIQARHISVHEIPGPWTNAGPFQAGSTGNVNVAAIAAAGGTANWSQVVDNDGNKPADNADVTAANQAATIANQGSLATKNTVNQYADIAGFSLENLIPNGNFAQTSAFWSLVWPTGSYIDINNEKGLSGNGKNALILPSGPPFIVNIGGVNVTPGEKFLVEISARLSGGQPSVQGSKFEFNFYNAANQFVSSIASTALNNNGQNANDIIIGTVPSNAVRGSFVFRRAQDAGVIVLNNISVRRLSNYSDLTDDAVRLGGNVRRFNGTTLVSDTDAITSLGQAATIANQSNWATFTTGDTPAAYTSRVQYINASGQLDRLDRVTNRRLTLLKRADGATDLTEEAAITSLGQAATIASQGAFATLNKATQSLLPLWDGTNLITDPEFQDLSMWNFISNGGAAPQYLTNSNGEIANIPAKYGILFASGGSSPNGAPRADFRGLPLLEGVTYGLSCRARVLNGFNGAISIGFFVYTASGGFLTAQNKIVLDCRTTPLNATTSFTFDGDPYKVSGGATLVPYFKVLWGANAPSGGVYLAYPAAKQYAALGKSFVSQAGSLLGDNQVITNQGQAATIANQSAWATTSISTGRVSRIGDGGRVLDPTIYNTQNILGLGSTATGLSPTYTANGSNWTVNIPAHSRKVAGISGPVTISYSAGSGVVTPSTPWWCYVLDNDLSGGALTMIFTYNPDDLLQSGAYMLASGISPTTGTTNPPPPNTGDEPIYDDGGWKYRERVNTP